jgi:hypothetical protein
MEETRTPNLITPIHKKKEMKAGSRNDSFNQSITQNLPRSSMLTTMH